MGGTEARLTDEMVMGCSERRTSGLLVVPSAQNTISNTISWRVKIGVLEPSSDDGCRISSFGKRARCVNCKVKEEKRVIDQCSSLI